MELADKNKKMNTLQKILLNELYYLFMYFPPLLFVICYLLNKIFKWQGAVEDSFIVVLKKYHHHHQKFIIEDNFPYNTTYTLYHFYTCDYEAGHSWCSCGSNFRSISMLFTLRTTFHSPLLSTPFTWKK